MKDIICEWGIEDLPHRRRHQLLLLMYSQSYDPDNIDQRRSEITLRSRDKTKFKAVGLFTKNTEVLNSPYYRGVREWGMLPLQVQILSTKSKSTK